MTMKLPFSMLILLMAFAAGHSQSASTSNGRISGTVYDNLGAVVPNVKVVFEGAGSKTEVATNSDGAYRASLSPGLYQMTTISAPGFCPTLRAPFEITSESNVLIDVTLSTCPVRLYSVYDAKGKLIGIEDRHVDPLETDRFPTRKREQISLELVVRYGSRQTENGSIRYSGPKTGSGQLEISYDMITIVADRASLDPKSLVLVAEGNVTIGDGQKLRKFDKAELDFRNSDPISTLK